MSNRRTFLLQLGLGSSIFVADAAFADAPKVDEKDAQAIALGYNHDSSKVDKAKYPNHIAAQQCSNCQLFQGKAGNAAGPCVLFAGKVVDAKGWCSAYSKKA